MANKIKPKFNFTWFYIAAGAILRSMLLFDGGNKEQIREVKYSELRDYVERGYVEEITVHDNGEVEAYLKKDSASNVFKGAEIRENARPLVITTIGSADNFDEFIFDKSVIFNVNFIINIACFKVIDVGSFVFLIITNSTKSS